SSDLDDLPGCYAGSAIGLHVLHHLTTFLYHRLKALIGRTLGLLKDLTQFFGPIDIARNIKHMEDEKLLSKGIRVVHCQFPSGAAVLREISAKEDLFRNHDAHLPLIKDVKGPFASGADPPILWHASS